MRLVNVLRMLRDQLPLGRFLKNLFRGHIRRKFNKRSHYRSDDKPKVMYNTQESAQKAAESMGKKQNRRFSYYKCVYCNGYHIGGNN